MGTHLAWPQADVVVSNTQFIEVPSNQDTFRAPAPELDRGNVTLETWSIRHERQYTFQQDLMPNQATSVRMYEALNRRRNIGQVVLNPKSIIPLSVTCADCDSC